MVIGYVDDREALDVSLTCFIQRLWFVARKGSNARVTYYSDKTRAILYEDAIFTASHAHFDVGIFTQ